MQGKLNILLTNDDGIRSPGLWAAAAVLSELGYVTVVAPREQSSGMGRSLPSASDGIITKQPLQVNGEEWTVYAVGGSPAQAVLHGILEVMPEKPDLVVSGINYGANLGLGITISGTVGAAMEAAGLGYPALAMSLQADARYHLSYSEDVDFSAAAYFTGYFARLILEKGPFAGVDLLKVDVPAEATFATPWEVTRLALYDYYEPLKPDRPSWDVPGAPGYRETTDLEALAPDSDARAADSDIFVVGRKRRVSVTPLILDMTARVDLKDFDRQLR